MDSHCASLPIDLKLMSHMPCRICTHEHFECKSRARIRPQGIFLYRLFCCSWLCQRAWFHGPVHRICLHVTSPPNGLDDLLHALLGCCGAAYNRKRSLPDLKSYVDLQHTGQQPYNKSISGSTSVYTDTSDPFWTDSATSAHGEARVIATLRLYRTEKQAA